jgi:hypothetical protein
MQSLARLTRQRLRLPWVRPWRAGAFAFLDFRGQFSIIYRAVQKVALRLIEGS